LISPVSGKLIAVYLYGRHLTWRSALAALEDVFEAKLYIGRSTITVAYDLSEIHGEVAEDDTRRLLQNTFDIFVHLDFWKSDIAEGQFWAAVHESAPRQNLFQLWDMEKQFVQNALRRFSKERYRNLIDKGRQPVLPKDALVRQVASSIEGFAGVLPDPEPLVDSVKGYLGSLSGRYKLGFDLMTREPIQVPIEIVRLGRYGSREAVRYLMTKARLMRYSGEAGLLEQRWQNARPLLIVEGNLAGPDHDPFRYVRALVSVGWEVMSADAIHEIRRVLRDAYI